MGFERGEEGGANEGGVSHKSAWLGLGPGLEMI